MIFEPYTGSRWQIPDGIRVKKSVQNKFKHLETYYPAVVIHKLKSLTSGLEYKFQLLPYSLTVDPTLIKPLPKWIPPASVVKSIQSYQLNEIREWKCVRYIYLRIFKMKRFLKKLVHSWRLNKSIKNVKNTEDPVTLDIPKKCVQIIDFPKRLSYIYEASTLRKTIESRIMLCDYMFPNPLPPFNPFTNEVFTRGQLMSIISQCKKYGEFSWVLDRLYASECDFNLFTLRFRQPLKILAIENHYKGSVYKYKDEVVDYFQVEADRGELPDDKVYLFARRIIDRPNCDFVREWVHLTRDLYIAKELHDVQMLTEVGIRASNMIVRAYYVLS